MTEYSKQLAYTKVPIKNQRWLLETAIDAAKDEGYDISALNRDCLQLIDNMLKKIQRGTAKLPNSQRLEIAQGAAIEYAAAIIAIVENETQTSGQWYYHHKKFGKDTFPYVLGEKTIFPYVWALKTIQTPTSDSVKIKYEQIINATG
ncbi:hypothetical protein IPP75_01145 [Candidatus Saccharibacteria bacterium]|nr:MAG: hypothetical protein IPP75_01145 [Candidatus Saccharibacteria bacterium]